MDTDSRMRREHFVNTLLFIGYSGFFFLVALTMESWAPPLLEAYPGPRVHLTIAMIVAAICLAAVGAYIQSRAEKSYAALRSRERKAL